MIVRKWLMIESYNNENDLGFWFITMIETTTPIPLVCYGNQAFKMR